MKFPTTFFQRIAAFGSVLFLLLCTFIGIGHDGNNTAGLHIDQAEIERSRDNGIAWIKAHESVVLATPNPALWWMLRDSAAVSGNTYLSGLYAKYYALYLADKPFNIWHYLFDDNSEVWIPIERLDRFPDYNLLFLYGLSCQISLREDVRVDRLLDAEACARIGSFKYLRDPACVTHQLMGIRFMQQRECGDCERTNATTKTLQDKTALNSAWDFRVVDFYIQRILMLAESGAADRINPRWLKKIIEAQRADGGWDDFEELFRLGDEQSIGWSGAGIHMRSPESNFHTTAQGLYSMTLLAAHRSGAIDEAHRSMQPNNLKLSAF